jgi:hypothetical protein
MPKAYPVYDQNYDSALGLAREYLSQIGNLQLIGRNGQHRYNNQDHSMLTGMLAAQNIAGANHDLWAVSDDDSYLETITDKDTSSDVSSAKPIGRAVPRPLEPRNEARDEAEDRDRGDLAEVLSSIFAHFDPVALGSAVGLASGLSLFLATAVLLIRGDEPLGPNLSLLGNYFLSFEVSWTGALLGGLEAGVGGFVFGFVLAKLINFFTDLVADSVVREVQLEKVFDPLDAGKPPRR